VWGGKKKGGKKERRPVTVSDVSEAPNKRLRYLGIAVSSAKRRKMERKKEKTTLPIPTEAIPWKESFVLLPEIQRGCV